MSSETQLECGASAAPGLLQALASPRTYRTDQPVQVRETHASWVFLAGEWAYKVKKPVRLAFLDYSTLQLRRDACREELRVNRELAGDIYAEVLAIIPTADGMRLAAQDTPGAVEYALRMRRFEESHTLRGAIEAGKLKRHVIADVAKRLAAFHRSAVVCEERCPGASTLAAWRENLDELEGLLGADPRLVRARRFGEAFLAARCEELDARAKHGMVRDGHGDLRCEHVLLGDPIRVVDRVEFDPALRRIDVGWDLAFLVMDLEAQGQSRAARWLLSEYRHAGGDPGSEQLVRFYCAYWALVRAKVALIAEAEQIERPGETARRLLTLAEEFCWRARAPLAVVLAGPAASGKSTLARALSRVSGWPVISSDETRKRLAGVAPYERARPEHYTSEFTRRTYRALGARAGGLLARDMGVLIDATCSKRVERGELLAGIGDAHPRPMILLCEVELRTALERARARMRDPARVSDATPEIVARQFGEFETIEEASWAIVAPVDCEAPPERQVEAAVEAVDHVIAATITGAGSLTT